MSWRPARLAQAWLKAGPLALGMGPAQICCKGGAVGVRVAMPRSACLTGCVGRRSSSLGLILEGSPGAECLVPPGLDMPVGAAAEQLCIVRRGADVAPTCPGMACVGVLSTCVGLGPDLHTSPSLF